MGSEPPAPDLPVPDTAAPLEDAVTDEAPLPSPEPALDPGTPVPDEPWRSLHPASLAVNLLPQGWRTVRGGWPLLLALFFGGSSMGVEVFDLSLARVLRRGADPNDRTFPDPAVSGPCRGWKSPRTLNRQAASTRPDPERQPEPQPVPPTQRARGSPGGDGRRCLHDRNAQRTLDRRGRAAPGRIEGARPHGCRSSEHRHRKRTHSGDRLVETGILELAYGPVADRPSRSSRRSAWN